MRTSQENTQFRNWSISIQANNWVQFIKRNSSKQLICFNLNLWKIWTLLFLLLLCVLNSLVFSVTSLKIDKKRNQNLLAAMQDNIRFSFNTVTFLPLIVPCTVFDLICAKKNSVLFSSRALISNYHVLQIHLLQIHVLQIHLLQIHLLQIHVLQIDLLQIHLLQINLLKIHLLQIHVLQIHSMFYNMPCTLCNSDQALTSLG